MNNEISIKEFSDKTRKKLDDFIKMWSENMVNDSGNFPARMNFDDWKEQFNFFVE